MAYFWFGVGFSFIAGFVFAVAGLNPIIEDFQREAIERGYAQYCATTGEWAWKGECNDS